MKKLNVQRGFTLMELMIVIAIVGILASIAVPSYGEYVKKSRRADGMSELTRVMQQQEKYFLNAMTYVTDLAELGLKATGGKVESAEAHYQISAAACRRTTIARCVMLTAVPINGHVGDGNFTINSRGERDWAGNARGVEGWP